MYHIASIHGSFLHKPSVQLRDSPQRPNPRRVSVGLGCPKDRAKPQPGQEARVSSDETGSRIPVKECSSEALRPNGTGQLCCKAAAERDDVRVRLERTHCTSSKRSSARSTRFRSGGSGPNRSTCPNGSWLETFEPFPVAPAGRAQTLGQVG